MDYRQHFIFLIDDTGFNKKENMADALKDEVATNCVALIQSPFVNQVEGIMDALVQDLSKRFGGATEFHFTEIYNHTGAFEKIEFEETLEIIQMFNDLLKIFDIEIVTSTLNNTKDQTTENIKDFLKVFCKDSLHLPTDKINGEKSVALLNSIFTAKKIS